MTLKKLAAGSGYEYLTRQVAAADSTELGRIRLVDYYDAKGEAPGRWVGSGLIGIDGIEYGDIVTAEQMSHLFGEGCHPVTGTALGRKFGKGSVAGFDLTLSPAKSVSTLWAIAPPEVASKIQQAHDAAVQDALAFLEAHAVFTREGAGGARQVETRGLYSAGSDQQARADVLKDIREKLEKRRPDRDQFILAFEERFLFTNDYTRDKRLVQYVLERLLQHANPTTGVAGLTIEHLMPQDQIPAGVPMQTVGSIGNLLLVSEKVNTQLVPTGLWPPAWGWA